jgi:hypothetical protein
VPLCNDPGNLLWQQQTCRGHQSSSSSSTKGISTRQQQQGTLTAGDQAPPYAIRQAAWQPRLRQHPQALVVPSFDVAASGPRSQHNPLWQFVL